MLHVAPSDKLYDLLPRPAEHDYDVKHARKILLLKCHDISDYKGSYCTIYVSGLFCNNREGEYSPGFTFISYTTCSTFKS